MRQTHAQLKAENEYLRDLCIKLNRQVLELSQIIMARVQTKPAATPDAGRPVGKPDYTYFAVNPAGKGTD